MLLVERNHRRLAGGLVEQVEDGLGKVVGLNRTAGHAYDWDGGAGFPIPAEVVEHAHRAGRITSHRMDAAVGRAGSHRQHQQRLGREPIDPFAGGHWLSGGGIVAKAAPVAFLLDRLVRDRALDDEYERVELTAFALEEPLDEVVGLMPDGTGLVRDQRPVDFYFGQTR